MSYRVVRHDGVDDFVDRASAFLLEHEAENNLILSICHRLRAGGHAFEPPICLASVEDEGGALVGCAWRTPPFKAGLTRMPAGAPECVAGDMAELYETLPAVLAEESAAHAFAAAWEELRGVEAREGMRMRIHEVTEVTPPERRAAGSMRAATAEDRELMLAWWTAFCDEARIPPNERSLESVELRTARGELWIWEDGGPVCMTGISGRSPRGARIGPVYTPPEHRGHGYATTMVADVTRLELDGGCELCFLYTDLANPTSNSIYAAVGYVPVCDVVDLYFEEP